MATSGPVHNEKNILIVVNCTKWLRPNLVPIGGTILMSKFQGSCSFFFYNAEFSKIRTQLTEMNRYYLLIAAWCTFLWLLLKVFFQVIICPYLETRSGWNFQFLWSIEQKKVQHGNYHMDFSFKIFISPGCSDRAIKTKKKKFWRA